MICSTMGPAFFIFFQSCRNDSAGGGYPYNPIVFVHSEKKKLKKLVRKKVRKLHKQNITVNKESISHIADAVIDGWNPQPTIDEYQLEYDEALKRYKIYIEWLIQQIEDDELALLLIFANI